MDVGVVLQTNPPAWRVVELARQAELLGFTHVWTFDYPTFEEVQRSFFICCTIDQEGSGISGVRFAPVR